MSIENLNIILFSIPVYQLFYFTIQLTVAKKYTQGRILTGLLFMMVTGMAVINAFSFYGQQTPLVYNLLFSLFLISSLPTLKRLVRVFRHQQDRQGKLLRDYAGTLLFGLALILLLANFSIADLFSTTKTFISISLTDPAGTSYGMIRVIAVLFILIIIVELIKLAPLLLSLPSKNTTTPYHLSSNAQSVKGLQREIVVLLCSAVFVLPVFHYLPGPPGQITLVVYNLILLAGGGRLGQQSVKLFEQFTSASNQTRQFLTPYKEGNGLHTEKPLETHTAHVTFITDEEARELIVKLKELMDTQKPYTNPKFSLDDLCEMLHTTKRKAGYVINHFLHNNFYGLINEYRVQESIRILESDDRKKYTIDSIAQMAGFQSKSSFYSAFKKLKNITPGEYKIHDDNLV
ncbi:MAG: helix-turn-helix domain-containing protein [Bacteroidota bacterium]